MTKPQVKKPKRDSYKQVCEDLAATPNGAPTWNHEIPVYDPLGRVMGYKPGIQCLLCYKSVAGEGVRHHKDCVWVRARALVKGVRK